MEKMTLTVPEGLSFSDLELKVDDQGKMTFNAEIFEVICEKSGLPETLLTDSPDMMAIIAVILKWYRYHLDLGGESYPSAEKLLEFSGIDSQEKPVGESLAKPSDAHGQEGPTLAPPEAPNIADLNFRIGPNGEPTFNRQTLHAYCEASGISPADFDEDDMNSCMSVIAFWYGGHMSNGGDRVPEIEQIFGDLMTEPEDGPMVANDKPITIPEDLIFSDLEFSMAPDGELSFNLEPLYAIGEASGISREEIEAQDMTQAIALIVTWYRDHLSRGGEEHQYVETLIDAINDMPDFEGDEYELDTEKYAGDKTIFPPGKA